ncbi:MAG: hypothetical protein UY07_C0014G0003 [Parcubacteria group bacterium GW2011_GWA1_47_8]|nr:MAG: hypothetical protein UY07_C0014G0003 [Parcubacteria group bacterium GW2011_GWA1_47_8]
MNITSTTATSTIAGGLAVTGGGVKINTLNCTGLLNSGKLTVGADGVIVCSDDNGGAGGGSPSNGISGSVQFADGTGQFLSDANNFFWNNTTKSLGIGTTSPYAKLSVVGQVVGAYFTATTTTASTFPYASTTALTVAGTGGLQLATGLSGPLQANAGLVSATTSVGVIYGGTGLTTAPSYGNLLVGNASNGYTLTATSSLGLLGSNFTDWQLTTNIFSQSALTPTTTQNIIDHEHFFSISSDSNNNSKHSGVWCRYVNICGRT